jgi:hypothetical protein
MTTGVTEHDKQAAVDAVSAQHLLARAQEKLARKSVDVEVSNNLTLIQTLEAGLAELQAAADSAEKPAQMADAGQQLETLRQDRITATLVPLKALELLLVQGFVTEASLKAREMGFELDVQLFLMAKAERCGTIYLALRSRNNPAERYFKNQEDVALLDDRTLRELARRYGEHFVLTEDERKNLYGAPRT